MITFNLKYKRKRISIFVNSGPRWTSSYYMDENHSTGSEIQRPQYGRRSCLGSEPSTLETDVYVRRYALL